MRLGVLILPAYDWAEARRCWQAIDRAGFAHAWTYDHIAWRDLVGKTWYSSVPTLAAAAEATQFIQLGTLVSSPNFRHPVPFAKEAVTLADVSSGRFILGIGAGATGADAEMLGESWDAAERAGRFAEFVELVDKLLREPVVDHSGDYYQARQARADPTGRARGRIPLAIGATGPRGMRLAARFGDFWVTNGRSKTPGLVAPSASVTVIREQIGRLQDACEAEGRLPSTVRRLLLNVNRDAASPLVSLESFRDQYGTYRGLGVTDMVIPYPRREPPFVANPEVFEAVIDEFLQCENQPGPP